MNETELEIAASRSNGGAVTGQSKTSRLTALEYGVPSGISSPHPKPKLQALSAALRHRWGCSLVRIVLLEFCNFPLRILAILKTSELGLGAKVPLNLWNHSSENLYPPNNFLLACSEDIQRLQTANPWSGPLEVQMAAQAFQLGARWGVSNGSGKRNAGFP